MNRPRKVIDSAHDAVIVGGGPAGSTLAWKLKQAGFNVTIVDKKTFPRDKVCAGWVTPAVIESLNIDTADYAKGRVFQAITGFRTGQIRGGHTDTHYDHPVSYGIRRREFDHYLLKRSGATVINEAIDSIERRNNHFLINNHIETPLLIGAGGHFCPVARFLGAKLGNKELVVAAQEVEFEMTPAQEQACQVAPEKPELYFCKDLKGYAWVFRKQNYLNIGLGREDNHKLAKHVDDFVDYLKQLGRIPDDIPHKFHGHAYILYGHAPRNAIADGALLIGDSLGLAYPQSGEGIRPAIESALMAADVIVAANQNYSEIKLAPYAQKIIQRFGDLPADASRPAWLPESLKQFLGGKLLSNHWFAQHVVMDRWFLHSHQPLLKTSVGV